MPGDYVGEFHRKGVFRDLDLAFENKHRRQPDRGMGETVVFADGLELRRVGAAQHDDHVDVRGRAQTPLRRRAEQHDGAEIVGKGLPRRRGKFAQRCPHRLRQQRRPSRHGVSADTGAQASKP